MSVPLVCWDKNELLGIEKVCVLSFNTGIWTGEDQW